MQFIILGVQWFQWWPLLEQISSFWGNLGAALVGEWQRANYRSKRQLSKSFMVVIRLLSTQAMKPNFHDRFWGFFVVRLHFLRHFEMTFECAQTLAYLVVVWASLNLVKPISKDNQKTLSSFVEYLVYALFSISQPTSIMARFKVPLSQEFIIFHVNQ